MAGIYLWLTLIINKEMEKSLVVTELIYSSRIYTDFLKLWRREQEKQGSCLKKPEAKCSDLPCIDLPFLLPKSESGSDALLKNAGTPRDWTHRSIRIDILQLGKM
jgi:hypothetical protein